MADYFPLIARAVAGLDKNTGENRRALYERARTALVTQLRSVEPALEESEITRERLALEESIRKVEAEAVKRARAEDEASPTPAPREESRASLGDQGLRDFRETVGEVEGLGAATAEANRSARETYEHVPGEHPPHAGAGDQEPADHYFEPPNAEPETKPHAFHEARPAAQQPPQHVPPAGAWPPPVEHFNEEDAAYARPARDIGRIVKIVALLLVVAGIAGLGYWQRGSIATMVASLRSSQPAPTSQQPAPPATTPKIADRIGPSSDSTPAPANAPAAAVAQKVVLYDEDPNDPKGKRYVGSAIWRTETVSPGPGLAPELAVRADVEIPERRMRMTWSLRRNTDKALPASHTIEVMFTLPADFADGGIGNVPGVLMKQTEQARGVPLAGLAVKVTNGYFLIGLSAVDIDKQRNISLLKDRDWFDIPIVYTNGKRAILAVEKGTPGARAFEEAFRAWGQ
jgi:hypothetical protein